MILNSHGANRHTRAFIDLDAVRHNYGYLKDQSGNRLIAVVKADAYGHGAVEIAQALTEIADAFAVAAVGEAVALRQAGINQKILVMGGFTDAVELKTCVEQKLDPVLHHEFHLECLGQAAGLQQLEVWLKVDSGMGRLGFSANQTHSILDRLKAQNLKSIRLMTHLANADQIDNDFTQSQLEKVAALGLDDYEWGIANSAGTLGWPETKRMWARSGIALYGADPLSDWSQKTRPLKPVMTVKSRVLAINQHAEGDLIGYANTYRCPQTMKIAVIAIGYADGFPRHLVTSPQIEIKGKFCKLVGRVSMDMITVDVSALETLEVGDQATLFGSAPQINQLADCAETIAYEILCNIGAHAQRVYLN